jgi:hypothetical protein
MNLSYRVVQRHYLIVAEPKIVEAARAWLRRIWEDGVDEGQPVMFDDLNLSDPLLHGRFETENEASQYLDEVCQLLVKTGLWAPSPVSGTLLSVPFITRVGFVADEPEVMHTELQIHNW